MGQMKMSIAEISIEHVGPIEHLSIPVPEEGGVVVLHGGSGVGKTHAIQSVRALNDQGARKSLRPSDGMPSGKIEGLGVTVRLGRSNTAKGELLCESLDSGVDPSVLVDPGLKDPLAADSRRLATLVRLAGIKISVQQWQDFLDGVPDDVSLADLIDADPVVTADKIRRRLHEVALLKERIAESKGGESTTLLQSIADVDLNVSSDEGALASALDAATTKLAALRQKEQAAKDAAEARVVAASRLDEAQESALDLVECKEWLENASAELLSAQSIEEQARESVKVLEQKLAEARERLVAFGHETKLATRKRADAQSRFEIAERQQAQIESMRQSISATVPQPPSNEEIEQAALAKTESLSAVQRGEVVRRAKATRAKAARLSVESEEQSKVAGRLREIARSTDKALEQALVEAGFDTIRVYDGRLCVDSDRGLEPVSELSTGERWELALDLAARGLPKGAILSVQQEGWQALDQDLRRKVAAMAKQRGLVIVTAEVNCGDLRAELVE